MSATRRHPVLTPGCGTAAPRFTAHDLTIAIASFQIFWRSSAGPGTSTLEREDQPLDFRVEHDGHLQLGGATRGAASPLVRPHAVSVFLWNRLAGAVRAAFAHRIGVGGVKMKTE